MRNRAKCKLCESVIESFHRYDCVSCKCGEISVDGGNEYFRCLAKNFENFLRLDDDDNVIVPKIVDKEEPKTEDVKQLDIDTKPSRKDMLEMLRAQAQAIEALPPAGLSSYVTNYDLLSLLWLLCAVFGEDERKDDS